MLDRVLLDVTRSLADLVLPRECAGCGRRGTNLCPQCEQQLAPAVRRRRVGDLDVHFGLDYGAVVARVIAAYKQHARTDLADPLAAALRGAVRCAVQGAAPGVLVVPAPTRWEAFVRRGWRPVERVLTRAAVPHHRLLHVGRVADQRTLGEQERASNVAGRMRARGVGGHRVLLVDDVVTTGSTLTEMARAVRAAGGVVIGAACIAATPRRLPAVRAHAPAVRDRRGS